MKIRPFELVLITIFTILGLVALAILSGYQPSPKKETVALGSSVVIWGTVPAAAFSTLLRALVDADPAYRVIQYVEKDPRTFDSVLLNALADRNGPDIVFMPSEKLVQYRTKIQSLSEAVIPVRDFRNAYIDGAEIFVLSDGVYGYPVAVDPLVMYYNRDLLSAKNIITPPKTWPELMGEIKSLVVTDYSRTVSRGAVAFGEYRNVNHAFDILSLLLLQGGSSMVVEGADNDYKVQINQNASGDQQPLAVALNWYHFFSNPTNDYYSWNAALPDDRSAFVGEKLVYYFGKGSEGAGLEIQNPNLNFDIAEVPQGGLDTTRRTYGTFYAFSLLQSSLNKSGALAAMRLLASTDNAKALSDALHMAPALRSTLNAGSNDKYGRISYNASKVARSWLAPAPDKVNPILLQAVESVRNNSSIPADAAVDVMRSLSEVY